MTIVYHNIVYMILNRLLSVEDSMITPAFAAKLAAVKNEAQLEKLVDEVIEKQLLSPLQNHWEIPRLEDMELEVLHLSTYWKDTKKVGLSLIKWVYKTKT